MPEVNQSKPSVFVNLPKSEVQVGGWTRKISIDATPQYYEGYPGLHWNTFTYEGIDGKDEDGCIGELQPGANTPVELVANDSTFWDIPLAGKLTLLSLDPQGNVFVDPIDAGERPSNLCFCFGKGWIFCWVADKNQTSPAKFLETEKPGFKEGDLPVIARDVAEFNGHKIPPEFWTKFRELKGK